MRRPALLGLAAVLLAVGFGSLIWHFASADRILRVAVGPSGGEDARLVGALAGALSREREETRLKVVPTSGAYESARVLDEGKADLAVVRTDVVMPEQAQTVAIMHRDAVLLLAPAGRGIANVADLRGRTVALLRGSLANGRILDALLAYYDVPRDEVVTLVLDGPGQLEAALRERRADAVLAVGTIGGGPVAESFAAVAAAADGASPVLIPVPEADAIAGRSTIFESYEVVRGAFGGSPPRPPEAVRTIAVTYRLVAATALDDSAISELTRLIFSIRPRLAAEVPLANRIEAPDISKSAKLPVHSGAAAYYNDEVPTLFERYEDVIYLGIFALSIGGSAFAGLASSRAARRRARTLGLLERLIAIVGQARGAQDEAELAALEAETDGILAVALEKAGTGSLDDAGVSAFTLGLDQARLVIGESRQALARRPVRLAQAAE